MSEKKPFSESIIDVIKKCDEHSAPLLATLIKGTIITENHEAIIEAWHKRMVQLKYDDFYVPQSVLKSKKLYHSVSTQEDILASRDMFFRKPMLVRD